MPTKLLKSFLFSLLTITAACVDHTIVEPDDEGDDLAESLDIDAVDDIDELPVSADQPIPGKTAGLPPEVESNPSNPWWAASGTDEPKPRCRSIDCPPPSPIDDMTYDGPSELSDESTPSDGTEEPPSDDPETNRYPAEPRPLHVSNVN